MRHPSLRELQTRVMDAVLGASPMDAIPLIAATKDHALARLNVYRNNVSINFAAGLSSTYPVVRRLVGADYFAQIAHRFHRQHPSPSGDLVHAGRPFAHYLGTVHGTDRFDYLEDVARLEWSIQEALLAPDHGPLDLRELARVAPADYDELRFDLHPTLRLFESRYPTLRIWESNSEAAEPEALDLDSGGDRLAIMRRSLQLKFHRLSAAEMRFLRILERGASFAAAVEVSGGGEGRGDADTADVCAARANAAIAGATAMTADEFDAAAALRRFVAAEVIVGFRQR